MALQVEGTRDTLQLGVNNYLSAIFTIEGAIS